MPAATSDAPSASVLSKAAGALGAASVTPGVSLKGTVTYSAGSMTDSGPIEMRAAGLFGASVRMQILGGQRSEVSNSDQGIWMGKDGVKHAQSLANAMAVAAWFSPAHVVEAWLSDPSFVVGDLGPEPLDGRTLERLHCARVLTNTKGEKSPWEATGMDLLVDTATGLPAELSLKAHPDDNDLRDMPVRIVFGDYRAVGGAMIPYHIQKYLQGTMLLDVYVQDVDLTTPIPSSEFLLQ